MIYKTEVCDSYTSYPGIFQKVFDFNEIWKKDHIKNLLIEQKVQLSTITSKKIFVLFLVIKLRTNHKM